MAWIKVNPKTRAVVNCIERFACRHKIVGDFGGMYFQGKLHAFPIKYVYNWIPALCNILVPFLDFGKVVRREGIEQVPDRRSGESSHRGNTKHCGCPGSIHHLFRGTLAHSLWLTITPNVSGENVLMARIYWIAYSLTDEVITDGVTFQIILIENIPAGLDILWLCNGTLHFKVVARAG